VASELYDLYQEVLRSVMFVCLLVGWLAGSRSCEMGVPLTAVRSFTFTLLVRMFITLVVIARKVKVRFP